MRRFVLLAALVAGVAAFLKRDAIADYVKK